MNSNVEFEDNSIRVEESLREQAITFLHEAKDILVSQAQRNTTVVSGKTKRSFGDDSFVDENELIAYIGSSLETALWLERGTGEYAVNGDDRKGGWYVCADDLDYKTRNLFEEKYHFKKIKKDGKVFYFIRGMKPKKMLYKAYQTKKEKIKEEANKRFKEMNK